MSKSLEVRGSPADVSIAFPVLATRGLAHTSVLKERMFEGVGQQEPFRRLILQHAFNEVKQLVVLLCFWQQIPLQERQKGNCFIFLVWLETTAAQIKDPFLLLPAEVCSFLWRIFLLTSSRPSPDDRGRNTSAFWKCREISEDSRQWFTWGFQH